MDAESYRGQSRPGDATGLGTTFWSCDASGHVTSSPTKIKQDLNILHDKLVIVKEILGGSADNHLFIVREGVWKLQYASYIPRAVSGAAASLDLKVTTGTQAPSSGTTQLSAAFDLIGVADTLQVATLIAAPTEIGPGGRLSIDYTGTFTAAVGLLSIEMIRIR